MFRNIICIQKNTKVLVLGIIFLLSIVIGPSMEIYAASSAKDIRSFTLSQQTGQAVIDKANHTVFVEVTSDCDLSSLAPTISVSGKGSIEPASGVAQDFNKVVEYTVTARDLTTQKWYVTVRKERNESDDRAVFNIFDAVPSTDYTPSNRGTFTNKYTFTEGTVWNNPDPTVTWDDSLNPLDVYKATLKHDERKKNNDWEIRIGKGGQIYSFVTTGGELMPPQYHQGGEWIDEVIQGVVLDNSKNDREYMPAASFIHQAGDYWGGKIGREFTEMDPGYHPEHSWYSPMLTDYYDEEERAYYVYSWGQLSHVPNIYKSNANIFARYKDLGDGVIEVSYIFQNSGDFTLNYYNLPWGGVRYSNLPIQLISNPDGTCTETEVKFGGESPGNVHLKDTDGYIMWAKENNPSSTGMGWVLGTDKHKGQTGYDYIWRSGGFRYGYSGNLANRDYNVGSNIVGANTEPGEAFYYKMFIVVGKVSDIQNKAALLKDQVEYGKILNSEENCEQIPLYLVKENGQTVLSKTGDGDPCFYTYAQPPVGAVPLYLMKDTTTGNKFVSFDPYQICGTTVSQGGPTTYNPDGYVGTVQYRPYDGKTEYLDFMGWVMPKDKIQSGYEYSKLKSILTDRTYYPVPTSKHKSIMVRKTNGHDQ